MIERTLRPRKSDGGHSIIKVSTIRNYAGRERTADYTVSQTITEE